MEFVHDVSIFESHVNKMKLCDDKIWKDFIHDSLYEACKSDNIPVVIFIIHRIIRPRTFGCLYLNEILNKNYYMESTVCWDNCMTYACKYGYLDIAELMITKGATDFDKGLETACYNNQYEIAKLMLVKGAMNKESCFTHACSRNYIEIAKLIVMHGYSVDDADTCLECACSCGNLEIVELIFSRIKNDNSVSEMIFLYNIDFEECFGLARNNKHYTIMEFLIIISEDVIDWTYELTTACKNNWVHIVQLLLTNCKFLTTNVLTMALYTNIIEDGSVDISTLLINKGVYFNGYNGMGNLGSLRKSIKIYETYNHNDLNFTINFKIYCLCYKYKEFVPNTTLYMKLLILNPTYVLFVGCKARKARKARSVNCCVNKLPTELFRLLFTYC